MPYKIAGEEFLDLNESAAEFRVSKATVYRCIQAGRLAVVKHGGKVLCVPHGDEGLLRPAARRG